MILADGRFRFLLRVRLQPSIFFLAQLSRNARRTRKSRFSSHR
jgi:hypothetical protein